MLPSATLFLRKKLIKLKIVSGFFHVSSSRLSFSVKKTGAVLATNSNKPSPFSVVSLHSEIIVILAANSPGKEGIVPYHCHDCLSQAKKSSFMIH